MFPYDMVTIRGFFQSWKYFYQVKIEISDLLKNNESELYKSKKDKHSEFSRGKKTCCVHVRLGDYVKYPDVHMICDKSYYTESIAKFPDSRLVVFTENIEDVKAWGVWEGRDVHFVEDEPEALGALFLMSCCDDFIIANSTMSLWAYFLRENEGARLIHPPRWFGPQGPDHDIKDIIPV